MEYFPDPEFECEDIYDSDVVDSSEICDCESKHWKEVTKTTIQNGMKVVDLRKRIDFEMWFTCIEVYIIKLLNEP